MVAFISLLGRRRNDHGVVHGVVHGIGYIGDEVEEEEDIFFLWGRRNLF
jgi:ssRNA-specific RNase YbeY (16S rRNA maturation enzyme)